MPVVYVEKFGYFGIANAAPTAGELARITEQVRIMSRQPRPPKPRAPTQVPRFKFENDRLIEDGVQERAKEKKSK